MSWVISESSGLAKRRELRPVTSLLYAVVAAFVVTLPGLLLLQRGTTLLHWVTGIGWACLAAVGPVGPGDNRE